MSVPPASSPCCGLCRRRPWLLGPAGRLCSRGNWGCSASPAPGAPPSPLLSPLLPATHGRAAGTAQPQGRHSCRHSTTALLLPAHGRQRRCSVLRQTPLLAGTCRGRQRNNGGCKKVREERAARWREAPPRCRTETHGIAKLALQASAAAGGGNASASCLRKKIPRVAAIHRQLGQGWKGPTVLGMASVQRCMGQGARGKG